MNESCFSFGIEPKYLSFSRCVCESSSLKLSKANTHTTYKRNRKSYALLVLFYFIIFLDVPQCPCLIRTHIHIFLISHYYYVNGAQLRCIAFRFSRNLHAKSEAHKKSNKRIFTFIFFLYFKD